MMLLRVLEMGVRIILCVAATVIALAATAVIAVLVFVLLLATIECFSLGATYLLCQFVLNDCYDKLCDKQGVCFEQPSYEQYTLYNAIFFVLLLVTLFLLACWHLRASRVKDHVE